MDGYYLQHGFQALQAGKKELNDPIVLVIDRRISSAAEISDILTKSLQVLEFNPQSGQIPRFLLVGNIEEAAYFSVVNLINQGKIDCVIVKSPPQFGEMGKEVLDDIAKYAGCQVITDSTNLKAFSTSGAKGKLHSPYIGSVNRVVANKSETTLFADNTTETVRTRVQEIKDRLVDEISDNIAEKLRQRIAMLEGKIALFRIGGTTDSEKEEVEFRVEDSINATRAAQKFGVVPGGAATLIELSKCEISPAYRKALCAVFKRLLRNAALPAEVKLAEILEAEYGYGYNLREGGELVDLVTVGILDPKQVVEEVIKNATSVAHIALTTGVCIVFEDKE